MRIRNGYISVLYFSFSSCIVINFIHFFDRVNNIFLFAFSARFLHVYVHLFAAVNVTTSPDFLPLAYNWTSIELGQSHLDHRYHPKLL